jgi:hypothetical protein
LIELLPESDSDSRSHIPGQGEENKRSFLFRGQQGGVLSREHEGDVSGIQGVQSLAERRASKRMNIAERIGMDKQLGRKRAVFLKEIRQLMGRAPVEITRQSKVNAVAVSVDKDLEIAGH